MTAVFHNVVSKITLKQNKKDPIRFTRCTVLMYILVSIFLTFFFLFSRLSSNETGVKTSTPEMPESAEHLHFPHSDEVVMKNDDDLSHCVVSPTEDDKPVETTNVCKV